MLMVRDTLLNMEIHTQYIFPTFFEVPSLCVLVAQLGHTTHTQKFLDEKYLALHQKPTVEGKNYGNLLP
jgi:hypothetical protein